MNGHQEDDGVLIGSKRTGDCLSFDITSRDINDFISNVSFLKSFFDSIVANLPKWVKFAATDTSILNVQDVKSELVYGNKMDDVTWCNGAPVIPDHLYNVFLFDSNFFFSIYNNAIQLPKPLNGQRFCLIVDMCHHFAGKGSVFLMVPKESQDLLSHLEVFQRLHEKQNLLIKPRGIGVSLVNGIDVQQVRNVLQQRLWNGDHMFDYK